MTPDDGRKFTELYNVQHLQSNALDRVSKVCITTVQRLYSMLRGEADFDAALEDRPLGKMMDVLGDGVREAAIAPFDSPGLRDLLTRVKRRTEQTIDMVSQDQGIEQPPRAWTTEALWRAYAQLEQDKVRGAGAKRVLTDLVSLVRHAVRLEDELVPYPDRVQQRYEDWLAAQEAAGRAFTAEQRWWLDRIAETIGVNLGVRAEDFQYGELFNLGGWYAARGLFGEELPALLQELNETLAT